MLGVGPMSHWLSLLWVGPDIMLAGSSRCPQCLNGLREQCAFLPTIKSHCSSAEP